MEHNSCFMDPLSIYHELGAASRNGQGIKEAAQILSKRLSEESE